MPRCGRDDVLGAFPLVLEFFQGDTAKATQWFTLPNPMLGGVTPLEMLLLGRGEKIVRFIRSRLPSPQYDREKPVSSVGGSRG